MPRSPQGTSPMGALAMGELDVGTYPCQADASGPHHGGSAGGGSSEGGAAGDAGGKAHTAGFRPTLESTKRGYYQSITAMSEFKDKSFEELRCEEYARWEAT